MKIGPSDSAKRQLKKLNIFAHVTPLLTFRRDQERLCFEEFKSSHSSRYIFGIAYLLTSFYFIFGGSSTYYKFPTALSIFMIAYGLAVPVLCGFLVLLQNYKDMFCKSMLLQKLCEYKVVLQSIWLVGVAVSFNLNLISTGVNGPCSKSSDYGCNYSGVEGKMPMDLVCSTLVLPLIMSTTVRSASWTSVLLALAIGIFSSVFTVLYFDLQIYWKAFVVFLVGCMVALYENQRETIEVFLLSESQMNLLDDIERLAEETHAKELRSMIANVAHDLKTPLTALVNGLEFILSIIVDMKQCNSPTSGDLIHENTESILETAHSMRHVTSFLLMSINRCLDYTKASNGVTLIPHLQSFRLHDLLSGPINCMKNLQDIIEIQLLPMSDQIHSHVVTDKQWFQENLLCILSNAVKFSTEGIVSVSVNIVKTREAKEAASRIVHASHAVDYGYKASLMSPTSMMLRIDVEDNGQGIKPENVQWVFTASNQAQRTTGGTGLGLYSLSKRIDALGGCYGVEARKDGKQGSNFWFCIPYRTEESIRSGKDVSDVSQARRLFGSPLSIDMGDLSQYDTNGTRSLFVSFNKKILTRGTSKALTRDGTGLTRGTTGLNDMEVVDVDGEPSVTVSVKSGKSGKPPLAPVPPVLSHKAKPLNILLVDDAISIQKITGMMLRRLGHTVVTAENGAVALKLLLSPDGFIESGTKFDVVLMDLQMPIMDGLEATKRLRAAEASFNDPRSCKSMTSVEFNRPPVGRVIRYHATSSEEVEDIENQRNALTVRYHQKVIGVSACSDEETIQAAYDAGIDAFIAKPFNMESFNETYQKLLEKQ